MRFIGKEQNVTSADVLYLPLRLFFTSNSAVLLMGAQSFFCHRAQGTLATPLSNILFVLVGQ